MAARRAYRQGDLCGLREALRGEALRRGFVRAGFTTAEPLGETAERRWGRWLAAGRAGVMRWLARERPRRLHPRDLLAEARSILVVAAGYYAGDHGDPDAEGQGEPAGKVARYAWGRDYHGLMRRRLAGLGRWLASAAPAYGYAASVRARAVCDSAPVDERALAVRAGLGFIGKNTLVLDPAGGSWTLLGALLTSIPFEPDEPIEGTCGGCRRCLEACPTQAFVGPYELDPRRCISYRTIEAGAAGARGGRDGATGTEPDGGWRAGWAFGCDVCQEVCPFNRRPFPLSLPELAAAEGIGPWLRREHLAGLRTEEELGRRWGRTPIVRPGLKALRDNLARLGSKTKRARSPRKGAA